MPVAAFAEPPTGGCSADPSGQHEWERGKNIKDPTCTESGTASYVCRKCGQQYTEEIPAAHTPQTVYGRAATCTTSGLTNGQKCSICDKVLVAQVTIPALGHNYVSTTTGEPTCTDSGYVTYVCTRCGSSYTTEIPASWHDWDDGKVTQEPNGFIPGVRTFTCKRDASHTMTEEINPGPALFNKVRGIPEGASEAAALTVSKQPAGGSISHDISDALELTVSAEGGTAPYSYEWYCTPLSSNSSQGRSAAFDKTNEALRNIYKSYDSKIKRTSGKLTRLYENAQSITPSDLSAAEIQQARTALSRFELLIRKAGLAGLNYYNIKSDPDIAETDGTKLVSADSESFSATAGDFAYYCIITDAAGRKVTTNTAEVRYKVYISEQPKSINFRTDLAAELTCTAAGGAYGQDANRFSYIWYNEKNEPVANGQGRTIAAPAAGEYYCIASDGTDTAKSVTVRVYDADPFIASESTASMELRSVDNVEIKAEFTGGQPPYYAEWLLDGETLETRKSGRSTFSIKAKDFGNYVCIVKDANGNTALCETRINVKQLSIDEQPTGGSLVKKNPEFILKTTVSDGSMPYNYYLYKNGQPSGQEVKASNKKSCTFTVTEPGVYQIIVEDHTGIRGFTDSVSVNDFEKLYVNNFSEEVGIDISRGTAALFVRVNGGKAPFTYTWEKRSIGKYGWLTDAEEVKTEKSDLNYSYLFSSDPEIFYYCRITDSEGSTTYAGSMRAVNRSFAPYFTMHPQNAALADSVDGTVVLKAWAVATKGDEQPVQYRWQRLDGSTWIECGTGYSVTVTENTAGKYRCLASTDGFINVTYSNSCIITR